MNCKGHAKEDVGHKRCHYGTFISKTTVIKAGWFDFLLSFVRGVLGVTGQHHLLVSW
jgi:hypothetical protein